MLIGRPEDLLALCLQMLDHLDGDRGGDHPVGARFHGRRRIGVDHNGAVRVRIAKSAEFIRGAADIQRAGCLKRGHQHALVGRQDLRRLAHEANPGHHQRGGIVAGAKAGHFQRIGDTAAGFLRQLLDGVIGIVMRYQHGVVLLEQALDFSHARLIFSGNAGRAVRAGKRNIKLGLGSHNSHRVYHCDEQGIPLLNTSHGVCAPHAPLSLAVTAASFAVGRCRFLPL